ncbi:peptidoglycan-binding protein [Streptomyces nogalater]
MLVIGTLATTGAPASALTTARHPERHQLRHGPSLPVRGGPGTCVAFLQRRLNAKGAKDLTVDGVFGPATTRAVKTFQKACGFRSHEVDGLVGPKTWNGLIEGSCV